MKFILTLLIIVYSANAKSMCAGLPDHKFNGPVELLKISPVKTGCLIKMSGKFAKGKTLTAFMKESFFCRLPVGYKIGISLKAPPCYDQGQKNTPKQYSNYHIGGFDLKGIPFGYIPVESSKVDPSTDFQLLNGEIVPVGKKKFSKTPRVLRLVNKPKNIRKGKLVGSFNSQSGLKVNLGSESGRFIIHIDKEMYNEEDSEEDDEEDIERDLYFQTGSVKSRMWSCDEFEAGNSKFHCSDEYSVYWAGDLNDDNKIDLIVGYKVKHRAEITQMYLLYLSDSTGRLVQATPGG